jgi:pyruvate,water dikinase
VECVAVPVEKARLPALDGGQVRAVAELVRHTGRHFGRPQDIEWAIEGGRLYLLQSRPVTSLAGVADPDGVLNLWDNSNIAESYNGVTTPLTFSFARRAYEEVYRQFCRILRVPEAKIEASDNVFRHMLGLIQGRVYYNLLNWYRLLTLLPGFKANRRFMEQMMGVKEGLPEGLVNETAAPTRGERVKDRVRFYGSVLALVRNHFSLGKQIRRFYARLDAALGRKRPDLSGKRADELVSYYRDLERQLLTRWDAPLVNDFFAMIFYGVLGRLTRQWCGDEEGTLQNDLLCGEGGMISAEPAARVKAMAEIARAHPTLAEALCEGTLPRIDAAMRAVPAFRTRYEEYLEKFGDRCLEELKLESPTLFDDPLTLLRSVGHLARRLTESAPAAAGHEAEVRRRAEERVRSALGRRPLRRLLFGWVLRNARARVRDRENLRFERTRLFGRVRLIMLELGKRLHADDLLEHPRDVFYLEVEEALGFVTGTVTTIDLKGLVELRKAEFERYRQLPAPADRFETRGTVHQGNTFRGKAAPAADQGGDRRKGLGCCPGVVRGPVRVVTDPRNATLKSGEILVAERTDPGWIMLFPSAAGLLVERGSLLSHSAIVAREMGIPAVVSLAGVTRWLKDGDEVELDGSTGVVRRLTPTV